MKVVSGSVAECTPLQARTINKVEIKLRGIDEDAEVMTLPETGRLKDVIIESAIYKSEKGKVEVILINNLNKDIILKQGTQIGFFQVFQVPVKFINENKDTPEGAECVCSVQEDSELGLKYRSHLNKTSHPDLEQELISLLLKYESAVALPGDALGKTNLLKHQFRLKEGITLIYIPAYRLPHSKLATVGKLIDEMLSQDVIEP